MACMSFVDEAALFAQLIARTAKDIDVLIDSLPSEDSSPELQVSLLHMNNLLHDLECWQSVILLILISSSWQLLS